MKNFIKRSLTVLLACALLATATAIPSAAKSENTEKKKAKNYVEGEAIVVLNDNAAGKFQSKAKAASAYGTGIKLKSTYTFNSKKNKDVLKLATVKSSSLSTEDLVKKLKGNGAVKHAFPNFIKKASAVTNDAYSDYQWALKNTGQNGGKEGLDTKASTLWDDAAKSEQEQVVAIIDTGIDYEHEDLKDVVWNNPYGAKLVGKHGYDASGTIDDGEPYDDNGHGSHCAGIIAGKGDNNIGISGINKSGVKIMGLKFLNYMGSGSTDDSFACFDYAIRAKELGTNVCAINCSWGGSGDEEEKLMFDELFDELGEMGIITCVAAGNEESNIDDSDDEDEEDDDDSWYGDSTYNTPAASDSRYCLTVGASDGKDGLVSFSNYGKDRVDIAAPGTSILSTVSYNCFNPSVYSENLIKKLCADFQNYNGTIGESDFGYPQKFESGTSAATDDEDEDYEEDVNYEESYDINVKTSKNFFGKEGKSISITNKSNGKLYFEIPFKVDDADEKYDVSFMYSSDGKTDGTVYNVPASYTYDDIFGDDDDDDDDEWDDDDWKKAKIISEDVYCDGGYWDHITFDNTDYDDEDYWAYTKKANDYDDDDEDYEDYDENDRKLVFCIDADDTVYIDDLAISKTGVDDDKYGKYDFYNGTSMATPYVTGAIALVKKANPDSTADDVLNMVRNTGRYSKALKDTVNTSSVLSLDNLNNIPPFIGSVSYDENGKLNIKGSFRDITSVEINGSSVTPEKSGNTNIIVPDKDYNANYIDVEIKNKNGEDSYYGLLSAKKSYSAVTDTLGVPEDTSGGVFVNGGDNAYYVDVNNKIGVISYDNTKLSYVYKADQYKIDSKTLTDEDANVYIDSASMLGKKIYFTVRVEIISARTGMAIGYEGVFGYYDLESKKTVKLDKLDDSIIFGSSVGVYKNQVYVIGGYDYANSKFSNTMYKMGSSGKLVKESITLPSARAYSKFIEYGGKLVGVYGAQDDEDMPQIILFDGTKWTQSSVKLNCADPDEFSPAIGRSILLYSGNLGYDKDGIFCNGSYCFGLGDTFTYYPDSDKVAASDYSFNNEISGSRLIGTTVPGGFIGFNVVQPEEEEEIWIIFAKGCSKNSFQANGLSKDDVNAFMLSLDNGTPKIPDTPKPTPVIKTKKANPIKVTVKTKTVKLKKVKKKAQKVKAITIKSAQGNVTCKIKSAKKNIKKFLKINSKGVITIKKWKKAKKGTYKIKVQITAKGNTAYNAKTITKTVKVKVK